MDDLPLTLDATHPSATTAPAKPVAFAFATDPDTEDAFREGLSDHPDPQVWPGDLRTAMAALALAGEPPPRLIFVDLDGTPYPAGAIHELAAVCERGTVVIALGSDDTARLSREVLMAGVSDYLVKPIDAAAVREAAARAAAPPAPAGGCVVGLAGTGGSGATTVAAAAALLAAERGRYVSVLDLNRTFAALPFVLDVEPAAGLDELLHAVGGATAPSPEMVDGVGAERSSRIAVYGYRWGPAVPPPPPAAGVRWLLGELARRSHLVLVDGLGEPSSRFALLAGSDVRVLVAEPTRAGAGRAARVLDRMLERIGRRPPPILVQNHTRAFRRKAGARILRAAGVEPPPEVVVPFERSLPALADRGWPGGRVPRPIAKPLDALLDRLLTPAAEGAAVGAGAGGAGFAPVPAEAGFPSTGLPSPAGDFARPAALDTRPRTA